MKKLFSLAIIFLLAACCESLEISPTWSNKFNEEITVLGLSDNFLGVCFEDKFSLLNERGILLWNYTSEDKIHGISVSGNRIAVVSTYNVHLLRSDGALEWKKELDSWVDYSKAISISTDRIVLGLMNGQIHFFDMNGNETFGRKLDAYILAVEQFEGNIIVVSDKGIYLLDEKGNTRLEHKPKNYIRAAAIYGPWVVLALGNNALEIYKVNEGLEWNYQISDKIGAISLSDKYVAVGTKDGSVYFFDSLGNLKWEKQFKSSIKQVAILKDSVIVSRIDNEILIMNDVGTVEWDYKTNEKISFFDNTENYFVLGTSEGSINFFQLMRNPESGLFILVTMIGVVLLFAILFYRAVR